MKMVGKTSIRDGMDASATVDLLQQRTQQEGCPHKNKKTQKKKKTTLKAAPRVRKKGVWGIRR